MATEPPNPGTEEVKMDLFDEDDEFEYFVIDHDSLGVIDAASRELETITEKNEAKST